MTMGINLLRDWAEIVESIALFAIIILAIGCIVSAIKLSDVVRYLGMIIAVTVLLTMLPAIMVNAWSAMTYWQHLGILILGGVLGFLLRTLCGLNKKRDR